MTSGVKQTVIKNPSWWKRRTSMERGLTLISCIAVAITVALVITLATVLYQQKNDTHESPSSAEALQGSIRPAKPSVISADDVCLTPGCVHAASKVLDNMDMSVDPCDDFYQFACGNFVKKTNIPDDKASITAFSLISDQLQEQLKTMIEEPIQKDEPKPFRLVKNLYRACMNKTAIEEDGLKTIKGIMTELGGWPVLEKEWNEDDFHWIKTIYNFRRIGYSVDYFLDFSVSIDLKNSTKRIIDIDQPPLGLRREFLVKGIEDKLVKAYYDYMLDVAVIFGADRAKAEDEVKQSLDFEIKIANISLPQEKRRNATVLYNPMTIKELQEKYNFLNWLEYMNTLLAPDNKITDEEVIIVNVPSYIADFMELIEKTPKRVQANYLLWRVAVSSISFLTDELRDRQLKYTTIVTGKTERASRWKECIDVSSGSLSIAAGALYVRKYFNEAARQNALEMVTDIRAEFRKIVQNVDWMDDKTKQNALSKADSMTTHIAYPDELLDNKKIEEFYKDLELDETKYLKSILNLTLFGTQFSFKRLRLPVNKTDWIAHGRPAIVNAFYSSIENSIQFPAGILQGVFFSNDRPRYMNYGGIGFVIGHEITHGFDDQGRQFDKNGNLVDWWEADTKKAFVKKAQCIIDQYSNYSVPELSLNLNGINNQGENIADNGGIKEAYYAYQAWVKRNHQELRLPGLNYSPNQMFWLSAANSWCAKYRPESLKVRILTGYHSPGMFRVIGPMSNSPEFAKDFGCPVGSKMNPEHKCKVW